MDYRKPTVYIPPYNYCDRWCDGCRLDKSRCLLYQTEMDERLHREIDGLGEPTAEEMVGRIVEDARRALRSVEETVSEMGLEAASGEGPTPAAPPRCRVKDPLVDEALLVARAVAEFLRLHGASHPAETVILRRQHALLAAKLGRATMETGDALEEADAILQAQVAHRSLVSMASSLDAVRRRDPSLSDGLIDLLAFMKRMCREIEQRWLETPSDLLEPVGPGEWWGPLRDITPTLKHFRR